MNSSTQPADSMAHQTQYRPSIFILPPEMRLMIYKEVLVVPNGGVIRSFAPPALLQCNRLIRHEAAEMFYSQNHFEITIKWSSMDWAEGRGKKMPSIDARAWHRFLYRWDHFRTVTNFLGYVTKITLIYELSMANGSPFGDDEFDNRLGFRCSDEPIRQNEQGSSEENGASQPEDEDSEDEASEESSNGDDEESVADENRGHVGAFELCSDDADWHSRHATHMLLFGTMALYVQDHLWTVYPIGRLTTMLWLCVRDCPRASKYVDFICEDEDHWVGGNNPYTVYDPAQFFDPDDEDF